MRNSQGTAFFCSPEGTREQDTFTCYHCNRVVLVPTDNKVESVGDFCRQCMRMVCDKCAGHACVPFLKKLERYDQRYHARRQFEIVAGL